MTSAASILLGGNKAPIRRLNLNRANLAQTALNRELNDLIEASAPLRENHRHYLGASAIGSECLRKTQYDWLCDPEYPVRTKDIFDRGHHFEARMRGHLIGAGFQFGPQEQLSFSQLDGLFRGHADGMIVAGPPLVGLIYPCLWENKCLKAQSWRAIERDGLKGIYEIYLDQVALYQAYLKMTNPCLFTVVNADTCERLSFAVPFDPQRAQVQSDRAFNIIEATRAGELLSRGFDSPDDFRCKMCPWRQKCWGEVLA